MGAGMFEGWGEFYILLGGAAAALVGLLFVVTTLAGTMHVGREQISQGAALYMTPTLFHYVTVLVMSALGTVPGVGGAIEALVLAPWALVGVVYCGVMAVLVRTRRLPRVRPLGRRVRLRRAAGADVSRPDRRRLELMDGEPQRALRDRHRARGASRDRHPQRLGFDHLHRPAQRRRAVRPGLRLPSRLRGFAAGSAARPGFLPHVRKGSGRLALREVQRDFSLWRLLGAAWGTRFSFTVPTRFTRTFQRGSISFQANTLDAPASQ